jgi:hypothetical protein
MATYGEFIRTPYSEGLAAGVNTLLHMTRFELGLAAAPLIAAISDPYGKEANAAYQSIDDLDPNDPAVAKYGDLIASSGVALMPTFSLFYSVLPGHRNLWREPAAAMIDAKALGNTTSDPATGELKFPSPKIAEQAARLAAHSFAIDKALIARGAMVLAGSGSTWQGSLPGLSMHTELALLVRAGLTPRAALAAATQNYSDQFGWTELGAVAAGRRADLLILAKDPTADIANIDSIDAVWLGGKKLDRAALLPAPGAPSDK